MIDAGKGHIQHFQLIRPLRHRFRKGRVGNHYNILAPHPGGHFLRGLGLGVISGKSVPRRPQRRGQIIQ